MILNETADSPPSAKAAARFLLQAAFGPDQDDPEDDDQIPENVEEVRQMGFAAWIDDQFTRPVGRLQPFVEWAAANENALQIYGDKKNYAWWNRAMGVPLLPPDAPPEQTQLPDPLRQRVAFAFSQIIVISDRLEDLAVEPVGMAHFYDHLLAHSFGNFRDLLRGQTTPARIASPGNTGTATMADVDAAIDNLFHHPDTGPFIGRQLIQRFVTSNPSPAYVGRVAAAFADNGAGVRGDLSAVIKTLLLDPEARDPARLADAAFGKLREPFLRCVNLARAFNATAQDGFYSLDAFNLDHLQQPFNSPSVFNFFLPTYSPPGPLTQAGLTAPGFQLVNDSSLHTPPRRQLFLERHHRRPPPLGQWPRLPRRAPQPPAGNAHERPARRLRRPGPRARSAECRLARP